MIKTQLRPRKPESWVSGVTVRQASITEMVTAMALRSEARMSGRRVELFEGGPRVGHAHAAWYLDDPPLVVHAGSCPASSCCARCCSLAGSSAKVSTSSSIARPWARLRRTRSSEFASCAFIRPMIAIASWPGRSTVADSTA